MILRKKQPENALKKAVFIMKKKWKTAKKRQKHWKMRIYLTLVLPAVLIAAIIKAVRTYIRLKIRDIAEKTPSELKKENQQKGDCGKSFPADE